MQNIEDENTRSAVEAASGTCGSAAKATTTPAVSAVKPAEVNAPVAPAVQAVAAPVAPKDPTTEAAITAVPPVAAEQPPVAPQVPVYINIDDFAKIELRVAQILVAERIPKADKLLRLEVDLGYEKRQILAGIAQYYEPEKLIGRKIVIVANLAPRKMRGLMSNGMLLAASLEGGAPALAGFLEEVPLGARLK
jgi:methionyl-tRNA synthetase